jgi:hypothetical protein
LIILGDSLLRPKGSLQNDNTLYLPISDILHKQIKKACNY